MNKSETHLHDLSNKLIILYGILSVTQKGFTVPSERIDAVQTRINEIVKCLKEELRFKEPRTVQLAQLNRHDFCDFINYSILKLRKIYGDLTLSFSSKPETWSVNYKINIERELLYQAIENAVENASNAHASTIDFNLIEKQKQTILEISDNGQGLKDIKEANSESPLPKVCGIHIIKENLKQMGARSVYAQNSQDGVTLSFVFTQRNEISSKNEAP